METSPTIQVLALEAIKVDQSVQSRVARNPFYEREFSEAMLRGDRFPPVTTFFDGKINWLADGFHRYYARLSLARMPRAELRKNGHGVDEEFTAIKAAVYEGSKLDAIIFSAGANKTFSIPRTSEDKRRAVFLLRATKAWRDASPTAVARHVGVGPAFERKASDDYFHKHPDQRPEKYRDLQGREYDPWSKVRESKPVAPKLIEEKKPGGSRFLTRIRGKKISLGKDPDRAASYLAAVKVYEKSTAERDRSDREALDPLIEPVLTLMQLRGIGLVRITLTNNRPVIKIRRA